MIERLKPHIAVMDLDMPQMGGLEATRELVARNSATKVLILTMHTEDEYLVTLLEAGAAGFLVKNAAEPRARGRHPGGGRRKRVRAAVRHAHARALCRATRRGTWKSGRSTCS